MKANYHTHTRWCRHGQGEIEDYILTAISHGYRELAITEHVPHRDNLDPRRLQWEEFPEFNAALDRAFETYGDRIRLIKGFECEYYPECLDTYREFRDRYGYGLLLLGQHRSGKNREIDNFAPKGVYEMECYADEICLGLQENLFRVIAHPDLAVQGYGKGWDEHCERVMRQIFEACEREHVPVEINVNGLRNGRAYPCKEAFLLSKDYDLQYLVGADAHDPKFLCGEPVEDAERFARELGIEVMEFLK